MVLKLRKGKEITMTSWLTYYFMLLTKINNIIICNIYPIFHNFSVLLCKYSVRRLQPTEIIN